MKKTRILLAASWCFLPALTTLSADDSDQRKNSYRFEFRATEKRASGEGGDRRGGRERGPAAGAPGGMMDSEMRLYKVQLKNSSLSDVEGEFEARYTLYLKAADGRGDPRNTRGTSNVRTVEGVKYLEPLLRGNRTSFETDACAVTSGSGSPQGGPPGGGGPGGMGGGGQGGPGGGQNPGAGGGPGGPPSPEELDGIKIELYIDGEKVGEYIYGHSAKRAARDEKKRQASLDRGR